MKKERLHIDANLKLILKNKQGFTIPENYFSELTEENLQAKIFESKLPKETGFIVAKDYFNSIDLNILEVLRKKESAITLKTIKNWSAIAAVLVISFCLSFFYVTNTPKKVSFDTISQVDIEYWIDNSPLLNSLELETFFDDVQLEESNFDFTVISSDAIEAYLLNENILDDYNEI